MNTIELKSLTKDFGAFRALNQVDMTVKAGEALGFLGPNGAGKSTTIRILLGLLRKTEGSVQVFGKDAWEHSVAIHQKLAYVPGDVHLWPQLTGGEVIDLFLSLRGQIDYKRKKEMLERFELDPKKKCHTYSKGNRQKVGLISAFASDVDLYILDEPTSGLDPLMSVVFQEVVQSLKKQGKTILMSSHIMDDVEKLCDRISIIRHGSIVETGTLKQLRHMTRLTIDVTTSQPVKQLMQFKTVDDLILKDQTIQFTAESHELNDIMSHLIQFGILNITSTPPSLESLFLKHYGEDIKKG